MIAKIRHFLVLFICVGLSIGRVTAQETDTFVFQGAIIQGTASDNPIPEQHSVKLEILNSEGTALHVFDVITQGGGIYI